MAGVPGLAQRLHDVRGGRVVFLAHCLLNENTRYLGGAGRAGCVGLFTGCLQRELRRRRIDVPYLAHDLLAELDGAPSPVARQLARRSLS